MLEIKELEKLKSKPLALQRVVEQEQRTAPGKDKGREQHMVLAVALLPPLAVALVLVVVAVVVVVSVGSCIVVSRVVDNARNLLCL